MGGSERPYSFVLRMSACALRIFRGQWFVFELPVTAPNYNVPLAPHSARGGMVAAEPGPLDSRLTRDQQQVLHSTPPDRRHSAGRNQFIRFRSEEHTSELQSL